MSVDEWLDGKTEPAPPSMPPELARARRLDMNGLRWWEYLACPAWLYDEVLHAQAVWAEAERRYPPGWDDPTKRREG